MLLLYCGNSSFARTGPTVDIQGRMCINLTPYKNRKDSKTLKIKSQHK